MAVHSKDLPKQINSVLDAVHSQKSSSSRPLPAMALVSFIAIVVGRYLSNRQSKQKKAAAASKVSTEGSSTGEILEAKIQAPTKTARPIKFTSQETIERNRKYFPPSKVATAGSSASSAKAAVKVGVNKEFFRQIEAIFKILIPKLHCKETMILILHTTFLVLRTYLSVVVARLDGAIVKDLIAGNGKGFIRGLGYWFAIALPATYTNSMA
ncbi:hypothetical protein BGX27_007217, partial [Mortierella sp. AM989]